MKKRQDDKIAAWNRFKFSKLFENLYYFFLFHIHVILGILGFAAGIAIMLFVAELIFPEYVHFFNYSLTEKTFDELVKEKRYHAAISFMEFKKNVVDASDNLSELRYEIADCYIKTGDYPKALEQYRLLRQHINRKLKEDSKRLSKEEFDLISQFIDMVITKEEFRIYMLIGDKSNISKKYHELIEKQNRLDFDKVQNWLSEQAEDFEEEFGDFDIIDGFTLELIQGAYSENPIEGLRQMEHYTIKVRNSVKYNPIYKLKCLNILIEMLLEQGRSINARYFMECALQEVDALEYNSIIFSQLGDLSDYCYKLNDNFNGCRLLKKYLSVIEDEYEKGDIGYLKAHSKELKLLLKNVEWDKLEDKADEISEALRKQIINNFTGMTAAQREYFIAQFKPIFEFVNMAVELHPSEKLVRTAFENNMFIKGLLLRSEQSVSNAIDAMGDKDLSSQYRKFVSLSQELTAREYISGPGNAFRKKQLRDSISELEASIAAKSMEFQRSNSSLPTLSDIRKALNDGEYMLQIIAGEKSYYALMLDRKGKIAYNHIASKTNLLKYAGDMGSLYADASIPHSILGKVMENLNGSTVFYSATGIFNHIAIPALCWDDNGLTLGDIAKFRLLGNPADIKRIKKAEYDFNLTAKNTLLWGGIQYGDTVPTDNPHTLRAIERGEELHYLRGSEEEVLNIKKALSAKGYKAYAFTGKYATEKSFMGRSGKRDYILHISTHGFFHDDQAFVNPMQNSGLLFANSQAAWKSNTLLSNLNQTDGVLRADEIANMNLNGCRLVVLSACQTGLGYSDNSEGVYGLQRAFKLAGAQSVLMSLWSVDDKATAELMTEFYNGLIAGHDPDDALVSAQRSLRQKGYSPDKWAAFVLLN